MNLDKAVKYHYGQFPPQQLEYGKFLHQLVAATSSLARYDQMLKNMHNSEILLAPLRNQEAVISSRIEGTISTMDEILEFQADENSDEVKATAYRSDIFETVLYQRALKNAQRMLLDGYDISKHLICRIHQQLLSYGRGASKEPGKFKYEQNYLGDIYRNISFIPVSPEKLNDGLEDLFSYIKESTDPVLIKTAVTHLEFEALHPFQDGNGRIGRMLITLLLWKEQIIAQPHFYISGYLEQHKEQYIETMRNVSAHNDWESWCVFFLNAVEAQAKKNLEIAEQIQDLYEKMKGVFSAVLSSKFSMKALDFVFTNPVFRNNKFTSNSGIPAQTAANFTRKLLDERLIVTKEEAAGRRPALYSFEPLMDLVRV